MPPVASPPLVLGRRIAPFFGAAALAFALIVPDGDVRWGRYALAGALMLLVAGVTVAAPWRRLPRTLRLIPSLLFIAAVFLLRDAAGGANAGVGILVLLPIFWQAMHGTRAHLAIVIAAVGTFFVAPVALIGGAGYPLTQLRGGALFVVVGGIVGASVQRLVAQVRREARDLERVAAIARALPVSADARREICAAACEIAGATFGVLFEPDGAGRLVSSAAHGGNLDVLVVEPAREPSAAHLAFAGRRPVFIGDPEHNPALNRRLWEANGRPAALLFEPVLRGEEAVGVLLVGWRAPARPPVAIRLLAAEAASAIERADLMARLADLAATDPLTGLPNRRIWDDALLRALKAGTEVCVAMLDLDHFKEFNDVHGHQAGDRVLKAAAAAWRDELRPGDLLARYGGEEFAVLLPECDLAAACLVVGRLRTALPAEVTCSAGVARWDGGELALALVHRADTALYAAKRDGRNRAVAV